jgi:hypothetical protein
MKFRNAMPEEGEAKRDLEAAFHLLTIFSHEGTLIVDP